MTGHECIKILTDSRNAILKHLQTVISKNPTSFTYKTFGTSIEPFVTEKLIDILKDNQIVDGKNDYKIAPDKNYFPDFTLLCTSPKIAIEIKTGNHSKKQRGVWRECNNSGNDLGTLNKWPQKLREFGIENIFFLFVEYNFNDRVQEIVAVTIDHFYKFVGLNANEAVLKYREKDGNLRPKNFDEQSPITFAKTFEELFTKTVTVRSKRIIKKHLKIISPAACRLLLFEVYKEMGMDQRKDFRAYLEKIDPKK